MTTAFSLGVVILAGGRARRMGGRDKALLRLGGRAFIERLLDEVRGFPEILLSVGAAGLRERMPATTLPITEIVDDAPGNGPLQGLAQALARCRSDALLALAVDMPLFRKGVAGYLAAFLRGDADAVVAKDREGRRHPLCAVYRKSAAPVLLGRLAAGERRLRDALALLNTVDAPLEHSAYPPAVLANANTPADLDLLRAAAPPPVFAVCGAKNAGKTTLLRKLIPLLRARKLRVGVLKHDGHDFVPDVPGTDSRLLREAGAERVAVYSRERFLLTAEEEGAGPESLLPRFAGCDIVLLEGGKSAALPKLEVVRGGERPVCPPETLLALCAEEVDRGAGVPVFHRDDAEGVCRFVCGVFDLPDAEGAPHA